MLADVQLLPNLEHPHVHLEASSKETQSMLFYITFMLVMLFFFVCSAVIEKYKPSVGHETTYTIIVGVLFSIMLFYATPNLTQEQ